MLNRQRLLEGDEQKVVSARPSWLLLLGPLGLGVAIIVAASWLVVVTPEGSARTTARGVVFLGALVALTVWVLPRVTRWASTRLLVTTERVVYRSGFFRAHMREVPIEHIGNVSVTQTLPQRALGVGDLLLESFSEGSTTQLRYAPRPLVLQDLILRQIQARQEGLSAGNQEPTQMARAVTDDLGETRVVTVDQDEPEVAADTEHTPRGAVDPSTGRDGPGSEQPVTGEAGTKVQRLTELADLHERGMVTTAEFERLKAELLTEEHPA